MRYHRIVLLGIFLLWGGGDSWTGAEQEAPPPPAEGESPAVLSLADCIAIALRQHPAATVADRETVAAAASVRQTRAGLYPQVSFSSGYSRFESTRQGFAIGSVGATDNRETSLQLSQLVWDSGLTPARVRQSQAALRAARWGLTETEQTLAFNVAQRYYQVLRSRALVRLNEAIVARAERDVDLAKTAVEIGTGAPIDILRAQVPLANAKVDLIAARKQAEKDLVALQNAMGWSGPAAWELAEGPAPADIELTAEDCRSRAYAQRPELKRQEATVEGRRAGLQVARIQRGLQLSVNGSYEDFLYSSRDVKNEWMIGATLSTPLFDGGRTQEAVRAAKANLEAARAQQEQTRQSIDLEVTQAYLDLESARERLQAAEQSVTLATENLTDNQERYREGVGSLLEVTDAQVELARAETNQVQAQYDLYLALLTLRRAMGDPLVEETTR